MATFAGLKNSVISYMKPLFAASSLRAPMRKELLVLTVTTSSKTYNIPDGTGIDQPDWRDRLIDVKPDGGIVYIQVSTALDAAVDEAQASDETLASSRYTVVPRAAGAVECWKIADGELVSIPFPATGGTFAIKGSVACKLRTHPSES